MSVRVMSMVFDAQSLTSTQKLVLLALADHANNDGRSIYPAVSTVAKKTGLTDRSVREQLKALRDAGLLYVIKPSTANFPNEYGINLVALSQLAVPDPLPDPEIIANEAERGSAPLNHVHPSDAEIEGTPEPGSPQGGTTFTPPLNQVHPHPEPGSPKSSINHPTTIIEPSEDAPKISKTSNPIPEHERLWNALTGELVAHMKRHEYGTWVQPCVPIAFEKNELQVGALNRYAADWLTAHVGATINNLLPGLVGCAARVHFQVL